MTAVWRCCLSAASEFLMLMGTTINSPLAVSSRRRRTWMRLMVASDAVERYKIIEVGMRAC